MSNKERSASAIQIEEKKERMEKMFSLAQRLTTEQIKEIKRKNPNLTPSEVVDRVKAEGIPKTAFINEYITTEASVSESIAKGYFVHLAERLKPNFIEFNPRKQDAKPTHFHLEPSLIEDLVKK